jgi:hypothetical protein
MKVHTEFTMFKPFIPTPVALKSVFLITLLAVLSGCPSQTVGQSVNITIDKQLLEQITGVAPPATSSPTTVTKPSASPSPTLDIEEQLPDESLDDDKEAMFEVVYDIANGLNDWDIYLFNNALHPNSAFAASMPLFFNQLVEVGTTHQINNITVKEQSENAATLRVNRYSTAFGSGKTEDLYYDLAKVNGEWKLFQIRSVDGSF